MKQDGRRRSRMAADETGRAKEEEDGPKKCRTTEGKAEEEQVRVLGGSGEGRRARVGAPLPV